MTNEDYKQKIIEMLNESEEYRYLSAVYTFAKYFSHEHSEDKKEKG